MRYFSAKLLSAALTLSLAMSSAAVAQDITLNAPSAAVISYDPFTGLAGLQDINVEITYAGVAPKAARLVVTPDQGNAFMLEGPSDPLYFEIDSPLGPSGTDIFNVSINLNPSDTQQLPVTFKIPSGQYADAGDTNIDLKMTVVDSASNAVLSNEPVITLVGRTPLRAQTNFAGTSAGFENGSTFALVDFGEITPGDSRNINFQVRGNSDVDISMSSENNGKLISIDTPTSSAISYSINADGIDSDLSEPLVFMRRPAKSLAGSSYPLSITLDNWDQGAFAGDYRDIITVDVTPR